MVRGPKPSPPPPDLSSWKLPSWGQFAPRTNGLAVSWIAPPNANPASVSAYDVRYIESDATDKTADSNWTELHGAWSAGGGDLRDVIRGLENLEQYDVQVRGVNRLGDGAWSATQTGTPETTNSAPEFPLSGSGLRSRARERGVRREHRRPGRRA